MTKAVKKATKKSAAKWVVVRTYSAGVHCGELVSLDGTEAIIRNARRIWRWRGANTLHEVALRGVDMEYSRISEPVEEITLTQAIEVISATAAARENLEVSRWPK